MEVRRMKVNEINPAPYNPRIDLKPGDPEYEALKKSIERFGLVDPLIWNKRTNRLVGGHQRLKVLKDLGYETADVVVVDLPESEEKTLNIALNKIQGDWEETKLEALLAELHAEGVDLELTGFSEEELENLLTELKTDVEVHEEEEPNEYVTIDWDNFKVFHVSAPLQNLEMWMPKFHYLLSYGMCKFGTTRVPQKPRESLFFVDSGLLGGAKKIGRDFLDVQPEVIEFAVENKADWVAMLDVPMYGEILNLIKMDASQAFKIHLRHAEEFAAVKLPEGMRKVYVVQGVTEKQFRTCLDLYKELVTPNDVIAIGGWAGERGEERDDELVRRTSIVHKEFPQNDIHLFGVTRIDTVTKCALVGATSCDSATASLITAFGMVMIAKMEEDGTWRTDTLDLEELHGIQHMGASKNMPFVYDYFCMSQLQTALYWNMLQWEMALVGSSGGTEYMRKHKEEVDTFIEDMKKQLEWGGEVIE